MFTNLTQNLTKIFDKLKGSGVLSEAQIDLAMRDIRIALLEADVALSVIRDFITNVKAKAIGQNIIKSVSPGQMIVKIIYDELVNILSSSNDDDAQLNLKAEPPVNLLLVGLQGSGKTTSCAKLALKLKNLNKKVLVVSLDTYRPAAQEQLKILAESISVNCLPIVKSEQPIEITQRAIREAKLSAYDIVLYDTAGRLHIDTAMIDELVLVKKLISPKEILLTVDAMTGQDAVTIASNFNDKLDITGVILSRIDGDARGGAALSIRHVTQKPIKFLSFGEKLSTLEVFDPKRIASRILDMGDIVSFVEKAADLIDKKTAEETAAKLKKGQFDLNDYASQIKNIKKLGGIGGMMSMLPGMSKMLDKVNESSVNEKMLSHQEAIILSMTLKERKNPDLLNASRRKRIADGAGTTVQKVNILLKQFKQISDIMKKTSRMNPKSLLRSGISKLFS